MKRLTVNNLAKEVKNADNSTAQFCNLIPKQFNKQEKKMLYRVEISGRNYLDRTFENFSDAEKYAAENDFTVFVNNVNNGNTIESQTYYYIEEGDSIENYDYGFEPCVIEEFEEIED